MLWGYVNMTFDPKDFESVTCPRCRIAMPMIFQDKKTGLCRECKKAEVKRIKMVDKKEAEKIGLLGKDADAIVFSEYSIDEENHGRNKH